MIKDTKIPAGNATIEAITTYLKENDPRNVLELGGGTGALSKVILENSRAYLDVYEHQELFQNLMKQNLLPEKILGKDYMITKSYRFPPLLRIYDLVIVDGGGRGQIDNCDYPEAIGVFLRSLDSFKTIIIEGQRRYQKRLILEEIRRKKYIYKVTKYPDPLGGKKKTTRLDCQPCLNPIRPYFKDNINRRKVVKKLKL